MFPRVKSFRNKKDGKQRDYLYICKSVREGKSIKQETVASLGRVNNISKNKDIKRLALSFVALCSDLHVIDAVENMTGEPGKEYGTIAVFRHIWEKLRLGEILDSYLETSRLKFNATEAIFSMVVNRLSEPSSKLSMYKHWVGTTYTNWDQFNLQHFYRAMDFLMKNKEQLTSDITKETKRAFKIKVSVVMFDCTTLLSYGEEKSEQDLLKHGFSKVKRTDLPQVLVGLIMSEEGVPLGYEVWEGNKSEKVGFAEVLKTIKSRYHIKKVVVVCDRGMLSQKNLKVLEDLNLEYILGVRMRQLSQLRQDVMLSNPNSFRMVKDPIHVKQWAELELQDVENEALLSDSYYDLMKCIAELMIAYEYDLIHGIDFKKIKLAISKLLQVCTPRNIDKKEMKKLAKRKYVVCYNSETAKEDQEKREYFRQIIEKKVEYNTKKYWIIRNGYRKYIKVNDMDITVDHQRLDRDSLFDGKWILVTNTKQTSSNIAFSYKKLWQIERHFRTLKSEIEMGPLNHWTEKRIKAHVCICFLALLIRTFLEKKLHQIDKNISVIDTIKDLKKLQILPLTIGKKKLNLRTNFIGNVQLAFKAIGAKLPPKTLTN